MQHGGGALSHTNGNSESDKLGAQKPAKPDKKPDPDPVESSSATVTDPQTVNTADGPNGGDPDDFETLTGVSSDWSHDFDNDDNNQSGGGSVDAGTIGILAGVSLFDKLVGLGALFSSGVLAAGTALISLVISRPAGHPSDMIVNSNAKGPRVDAESEKVVEDAVGDTVREEVTTNCKIVDSVPEGDVQQANEDFDEMGLENVTTQTGPRGEARSGTLPDGSKVTVRPSADGRPTIEINELNESGNAIRGRGREIRYGSN